MSLVVYYSSILITFYFIASQANPGVTPPIYVSSIPSGASAGATAAAPLLYPFFSTHGLKSTIKGKRRNGHMICVGCCASQMLVVSGARSAFFASVRPPSFPLALPCPCIYKCMYVSPSVTAQSHKD